MIWKSDGVGQRSPSSFNLSIEDQDVNSYRSKVDNTLNDRVIAKGMVKADFSFDMLTEQEAEDIMAETWKNPMNLEIKCPILGGKTLTAPFRCSKRKVEMIKTEEAMQTDKTKWKCSFSVSQKRKVSGQ